jgi:hypothetical protein
MKTNYNQKIGVESFAKATQVFNLSPQFVFFAQANSRKLTIFKLVTVSGGCP